MLGLGDTPKATPTHIVDGTDASFMQDVVETSKTVPVIVDFWAPWCGPCKTLGPAIEAAVTRAEGRVKLVKIDVDANPAVAAQLQVQSLPMVYAFFNGQPVDGFQGAIPPSEINAFVDKIVALGPEPDNGLDDAIEAAEGMMTDGDYADAAETFAAILSEDGLHAVAYGGLVRAHIALGDLDQAEAVLNGAPAEISADAAIDAAHAQLTLARKAANAGPVDDLRAAVDADPDNHQARIELANALMANDDAAGAVDQLLESFRRDREWNDGAARTELFTIFDALAPTDPVVLNGRRKLSSMIFA
ncbi:MAG: co-chaperone YbbN [Yoonia sp.]|nr:co-chaperone YbbN [Yoonia sp.]